MKRSTILSLVMALAVGMAIGWLGHMARGQRELRAVLVARDLERLTFAVNTLNTHREQPEKVEKLQLLILRSSVENLEQLTREPVELRVSTPSLRQGLERATLYAKTNNLPELAEKMAVVSKRLFGGA